MKMVAAHAFSNTLNPTLSEALSARLGAFKPSDRDELRRAFQTEAGRGAALQAIELFVTRWEAADWVEEYALERIGRWLSREAPPPLRADLLRWARLRRTKARLALKRGLVDGPRLN